MPPRHRNALLQGLLDASGGLEAARRRQLAGQALRSGVAASARRAGQDPRPRP
jgi:hypothetical protein